MKVLETSSETQSAEFPAGLLPEMTLMDHLAELRSRLVKVFLAISIASVGAWFMYDRTLALLTQPLKQLPEAGDIISRGRLIFTAPTEAFFIRLKVTAFTGVVLALPIALWQLWRFVTPGLYRHERRYALPFVVTSMVLFVAGAGLAFLSLPKAIEILAGFSGTQLVLLPKASEYLSFALLMIAAFGVAFEFPVVLLGLTLAGVLSSLTLRKMRRVAWIVILVVAAIITPTQDPITLSFLAVPLGLLFEGTIIAARLMKR